MRRLEDLEVGDRAKITLGYIIKGEFNGYETINGKECPVIIADGGGPIESGKFYGGRKRIITQNNIIRIEDTDS